MEDLLAAKRDLRLSLEIKRLSRFDGLIIDDLGYSQRSQDDMESGVLSMSERYERGSVPMTSNLAYSNWEAISKDAMMTAAAIDRLVHRSVVIELNISSYGMNTEGISKRTGFPTPGGSPHLRAAALLCIARWVTRLIRQNPDELTINRPRPIQLGATAAVTERSETKRRSHKYLTLPRAPVWHRGSNLESVTNRKGASRGSRPLSAVAPVKSLRPRRARRTARKARTRGGRPLPGTGYRSESTAPQQGASD